MQRNLAGITIVVTGVTRGIGRALATQLAAKGAYVIGVARDQAALDQWQRRLARGSHR